MPFTFNGTTLTAVSFNGTNITTVIFNGTTVFSSMTVTFNANGGNTPSPTSKVVINGSTYGTLATISRTGHTFNGWFTASSGGTQITSASTVTATANHTLFAQWTAVATNQTSTPSILSMSCINYSGDGSVSVPVRNNDALSATVQVSYNSTFAAGTVQSATISPSSTLTFEFFGYSVPPGTVTFYARAQASGKTMSATATRTQTINICFGEF
jgi:uncharacterized repeat protein (TIGR02543 family)